MLLTVSGPGAVHGIAGLSHAAVNCFPLIMVSGSCEQVSVNILSTFRVISGCRWALESALELDVCKVQFGSLIPR